MNLPTGPDALDAWLEANGVRTPDLRGAVPEAERGEPIGRYLEVGTLGRGGGGEVVSVWDATLRRVVAAKLQSDITDGPQAARLVREARIGGQLEHPNIVPIHEAGVDEKGRVYFTMRRVDGASLRDLIYGDASEDTTSLITGGTGDRPHGDIRLVRLLGIFLKLCEAVSYAHSRGVIHRDLKPHNVMIGQFGEVWLVDWGLCWLVDDSDRSWTSREAGQGTPAWMPPEALSPSAPEPSSATDVYALGAILHCMLCGEPPWRGSGMAILLEKSRTDPPTPSSVSASVPWELEAVVLKAMAREPLDRYASVGELAADVEAFVEGRVLQAPSYGTFQLVRHFVRRHRAAVGVGAVAVVALSVLAGLSLWRLGQEKAVADGNLAAFRRLADVRLLDQAEQQEGTLWPAHPQNVANMDAWLDGVEPLSRRLEAHRSALSALESDQGAGLDAGEVAWLRTELGGLVERLTTFTDAQGPVAQVRARRESARTLERRSLIEHQEAWNRAITAIAAHPNYDGLAFAPILGLVPLGPDPGSGLWEFGDLESGALPSRDAEGHLALGEEHGIVYVLVPGGPTQVLDGSGSDTHVTLAPFLLAKHELTQAQWTRIMGKNPSHNQAGSQGVTALHPVEYVSWHEAMDAAARVAATLPTEAQWEAATRGGTRTDWWSGDAPEALATAGNLVGDEDGFGLHAPIGSFAPNPYGLHDVVGNVYEWTLDPWGEGALVSGSGLREIEANDHRAIRGGGYTLDAGAARSDARIRTGAETRFRALGLRLLRQVEVAGDE